MHSRQVSDDEEDEVRFNRFANERKKEEEKEYRRSQRETRHQRTQDWLEEGEAAEANGEGVDVEEEVPVEPVVRPKNPAMFKNLPADGFKAPRLPRHRALTGRNSPPRPPPRQVPSFHQGRKFSDQKSFIRFQIHSLIRNHSFDFKFHSLIRNHSFDFKFHSLIRNHSFDFKFIQ